MITDKVFTVLAFLLVGVMQPKLARGSNLLKVKYQTGVLGVPCTNRTAWDRISIPASVIQLAQHFKDTPMPSWSDELYLLYRTHGDRSGQRMLWARQDRLPYLVLAECVAYDGSYLEVIKSDLLSLAMQRSWTLPSSDPALTYFNGTQYFVELNSAAMAADLGLTLHLMGDLINTTLRAIVTDAISTRVFQPLKDTLQGHGIRMWWIKEDTNWNAVCWAGVMIAVFCALQDADERTFFAEQAIENSQGYLKSFQDDGFGSEGVGYYNYGFASYALLRQVLYEGTDGAHDSFANPKAAKAALFSEEFGMSRTSVANFGDTHFETVFRQDLVNVVGQSFGPHFDDILIFSKEDTQVKPRAFDDNDMQVQPRTALRAPSHLQGQLNESLLHTEDQSLNIESRGNASIDENHTQSMLFIHQNRSTLMKAPSHKNSLNLPWHLLQLFDQNIRHVQNVTTRGMNDLRRHYNESGVLVARPNALNNGQGLAATFKLGGNIGTHSHNDIGSYVISVNSVQLTGDPGGPKYYDADSFNHNRYTSPLMNSYGHPLPVINGKLQERATYVLNGKRKKKPSVVHTSFTESKDTIVFDMTSAYDEPNLEKLTRKQTFDRDSSRIIITDMVNFSKPCTFEDALITHKGWTFTGDSSGYFFDSPQARLNVEVNSTAPFILNVTSLSSYEVDFKRIGVYMLEPVISATLTFVFYIAS